jgi:diguanylate cyclase (GGDEF)-like protein
MKKQPSQILVVDDEVEIQRLLKQRFRRKIQAGEINFQFAENGVEALRILQGPNTIDIVLTDIRMPEMDGLALLAQLAERQLSLKAIVISAYEDMKNIRTAIDCGAFDFLTKPIDFEELENAIDKALLFSAHLRQQKRKIQELSQPQSSDGTNSLQSALDQLKAEIACREAVERDLRIANQKLRYLSQVDALTQIANRRRFEQVLQQECKRLQREQQPLSLIMFDVDYFKRYNDHFGHITGDRCLLEIAQASQRSINRPGDLAARYGGEEFVLLLPNTRQEGAITIAERLKVEIAALALPHPQSEVSDVVTVSIGIASLLPSMQIISAEFEEGLPQDLIVQADQALFTAKQRGRNQYFVHSGFHVNEVRCDNSTYPPY